MTITLEAIEARQSEVAKMIAAFKAQASTSITISETTVELQHGEHYAGIVLDEAGQPQHHLVLLAARPEESLTWHAAKDWAASVGGELPTQQEASLIFANCKPHLNPVWHWTSEEHENASYAWYCHFDYGSQSNSHKSSEGSALAVRRIS